MTVKTSFRILDGKRRRARIKALESGRTLQDVLVMLLDFWLSGEYEKYMEYQELQNAFGEDQEPPIET